MPRHTFEVRSADGQIHCAADDIRYLCEACQAKAEAHAVAPDGHEAALSAAAAPSLQPSDDPRYQPFGTPPDGYLLALVSQQMAAEAAGTPRSSTFAPSRLRGRVSTPEADPMYAYAPALAQRKEEAR